MNYKLYNSNIIVNKLNIERIFKDIENFTNWYNKKINIEINLNFNNMEFKDIMTIFDHLSNNEFLYFNVDEARSMFENKDYEFVDFYSTIITPCMKSLFLKKMTFPFCFEYKNVEYLIDYRFKIFRVLEGFIFEEKYEKIYQMKIILSRIIKITGVLLEGIDITTKTIIDFINIILKDYNNIDKLINNLNFFKKNNLTIQATIKKRREEQSNRDKNKFYSNKLNRLNRLKRKNKAAVLKEKEKDGKQLKGKEEEFLNNYNNYKNRQNNNRNKNKKNTSFKKNKNIIYKKVEDIFNVHSEVDTFTIYQDKDIEITNKSINFNNRSINYCECEECISEYINKFEQTNTVYFNPIKFSNNPAIISLFDYLNSETTMDKLKVISTMEPILEKNETDFLFYQHNLNNPSNKNYSKYEYEQNRHHHGIGYVNSYGYETKQNDNYYENKHNQKFTKFIKDKELKN